jgi:outer membrane protein insertion porin family
VGRELVFDEQQRWLRLKFVISEGPRYSVRNVVFVGDKQVDTSSVKVELELQSGDYFDQAALHQDLSAIRDLYGSHGYVFADVQADTRFLEQPGQLDLVYNIDEGRQYRVGQVFVEIAGEHPHTRITTILNRISLQPGDICDIRELRASERRLRASGLFVSNPAQGRPPSIVFRQSERKPGALASRPAGVSARGQSPDPPAYPSVPHTTRKPAVDPAVDIRVDVDGRVYYAPSRVPPGGETAQPDRPQGFERQPGRGGPWSLPPPATGPGVPAAGREGRGGVSG